MMCFEVFLPVIHMLTVRAGVGELLETFLALVGLLPAVQSPVFYQVMFVLESLVTALALVGPRVWRVED